MSNTHLILRPLTPPPAPNATVPVSGPGAEWSNPADSLRTLYRRKGTILLITLLAVLAASLVSLVQPRVYRSVASLEIQGMNENFLNLRDVDPAAAPSSAQNEPFVKTQAELLQQDGLIQKAVANLKLDQRSEFRPHPGFLSRLFGAARTNPSPATTAHYAVDTVKKNLKIEPSRDSQIVRIVFDASDPQLAATFVNTLAQTFIEQTVDARRRAAQDIQEWLAPRIDDLNSKLQKSEAALDVYTRESGLILTPGQDSLATQKLQTLQDELSKAQADLIAKQAQYDLVAKNPADVTTENPVIRDYEVKLTDLRRQLADLESILQPGSYKVVRLQAQIAQLESAVRAETGRANRSVHTDFMAAERREHALAAAYQNQSALVSNLAAKITHYSTLKREVDTNRQFYEAMLQKVNEAGVASAVRQSNVRLVAPAEPEFRPYRPNVPLNLAIGLCAGLMLAVGLVMLSEQGNPRLRAPGEAGVYLNLPELGTIPSADRLESTLHKLLGSENGPVERVTWEQRFSELSEAFRGTVASIVSRENGDRLSVLVATSALAGEGKTTVVSNLGIALSEICGRVLLIDGDMRRPRLHKVFGVANTWGLSDVLAEQNATEELPLDALVSKTRVPRLYLLPSGPCTDSIFSLLYSARMDRLMQRFRREFDYVILDAPPCLEFADARILARYAEGVLLVLRANFADKRTALAAAQRLFLDGVPIVGTILNQWDPIQSGDSYGYGRYPKVYDHSAS
jgi:succinoglycan biosynthesis transport protein ExoP